jgi:hypothetical protein
VGRQRRVGLEQTFDVDSFDVNPLRIELLDVELLNVNPLAIDRLRRATRVEMTDAIGRAARRRTYDLEGQ